MTKYRGKPLKVIVCPECFNGFKSSRVNQKFCSDICRWKWYNKHGRKPRPRKYRTVTLRT